MLKKSLLRLAAAVSCAAILAGCGSSGTTGQQTTSSNTKSVSSSTSSSDTGELSPVTLKMYFLGDANDQNQVIFDAINVKLKEKINATIEPHYLSWGDYLQRYPLLFSSGEDFDMIYTASWAFYSETASKGGFYELTPELIDKYAPLVKKNLPENAWNTTKINGKNYMIPHNNYWANHFGIVIRGDLRKKYGMPEIKTIEQLEEYMQKVVENEPGMIPVETSRNEAEFMMRTMVLYPQGRFYLVGQNTNPLTYDFTNPDKIDLKPFYELDGFTDYIKKMKEWNQKGFFSKSDLTATTSERFAAGKSAVRFHNIDQANYYYQLAKKEHPDWEIEFINILEGKPLGSSGYLGNGVGFNARTKNIERALMAADLLNYDKEINFMINNGIPGVHSEIIGTETVEGQTIDKIRKLDSAEVGSISSWCFSNSFSLPEESFPGFKEISASYYYKQKMDHPLDGMAFVTDSVNTQVASNANIMSEYIPILYLGFSKDPEAALAEFKQKLKEGGEDEVNAELLKQAQAVFEAAKK